MVIKKTNHDLNFMATPRENPKAPIFGKHTIYRGDKSHTFLVQGTHGKSGYPYGLYYGDLQMKATDMPDGTTWLSIGFKNFHVMNTGFVVSDADMQKWLEEKRTVFLEILAHRGITAISNASKRRLM